MKQSERRTYLIKHLLAEHPDGKQITIPDDEQQQKYLLRALFNIRPAQTMTREFQLVQDKYLQEENRSKGIVDEQSFHNGLNIWRGDITRLKVDAIVNAANSSLTGCYIPNHNCIDNAIHTFAGIELRSTCAQLIQNIGHPEKTGLARITPAFNLPSQYVIHTVGPVVTEEKPTAKNIDELTSCYRNVLKLANQYHLTSIALPCISTGVFYFPNQLAAQIAIKTTTAFCERPTTIKKVIFDVFKAEDVQIYKGLLQHD